MKFNINKIKKLSGKSNSVVEDMGNDQVLFVTEVLVETQ